VGHFEILGTSRATIGPPRSWKKVETAALTDMIGAMFRFGVVILGLSILVHAQPSPPNIAGTWEGLFNGQPTQLLPDGSYPETRTKFRLSLGFSQSTKLTGTLTVLEPHARTSQIRNSRCDPDGCSFEVVDYGDGTTPQAWRIWIEGGDLRGMRNRGTSRPYGLGLGARLFRIEGRRVSS
jgi:hypothetical protein